ncbi:MAG: hypothetical protein U0470_11965 [Anaerolineae bacterium]
MPWIVIVVEIGGLADGPTTLWALTISPVTTYSAFGASTIVSAPLPAAQPVVTTVLLESIAVLLSRSAAQIASCNEQSASLLTSWLTSLTVIVP